MMTTAESLINEGVSQQNKKSGNGEASRCIRANHKARPRRDRKPTAVKRTWTDASVAVDDH